MLIFYKSWYKDFSVNHLLQSFPCHNWKQYRAFWAYLSSCWSFFPAWHIWQTHPSCWRWRVLASYPESRLSSETPALHPSAALWTSGGWTAGVSAFPHRAHSPPTPTPSYLQFLSKGQAALDLQSQSWLPCPGSAPNSSKNKNSLQFELPSTLRFSFCKHDHGLPWYKCMYLSL